MENSTSENNIVYDNIILTVQDDGSYAPLIPEIECFPNVTGTRGLSTETYDTLKIYGVNINVLKNLRLEDIDKLFPETHQFGEKVIFKNNLIKWRIEEGIPIPGTDIASTRSMDSFLTEWIASSSGHVTDSVSPSPTNSIMNGPIDIKKMLRECIKGKIILNYYEQHKTLSETMRNILVQLIVDCFNADKIKMTPKDFEFCARQIVGIFSTEDNETYYNTKFKKSSKNQNKKIFSGKLYHRYVNSKYSGKIRDHTDSSADSTEEPTEKVLKIIPTDDVIADKLWLRNNCGPSDRISLLWGKTFKMRLAELKNNHADKVTF